jgi:hypothetical protein
MEKIQIKKGVLKVELKIEKKITTLKVTSSKV